MLNDQKDGDSNIADLANLFTPLLVLVRDQIDGLAHPTASVMPLPYLSKSHLTFVSLQYILHISHVGIIMSDIRLILFHFIAYSSSWMSSYATMPIMGNLNLDVIWCLKKKPLNILEHPQIHIHLYL